MPRFKPLRQRRYDHLISDGFSFKEARALSKFSIYSPTMWRIRYERQYIFSYTRGNKEALIRIVKEREKQRPWLESKKIGDLEYTLNKLKRGYIEEEYPKHKPRPPIEKGNILAQKRRRALRQKAKPFGFVSAQYDSKGNLIGGVIHDKKTGRFSRILVKQD